MGVAEKTRTLAREGCSAAETARRLGIRYQYAYTVLKTSGTFPASSIGDVAPRRRPSASPSHQKPQLQVDTLIAGGHLLPIAAPAPLGRDKHMFDFAPERPKPATCTEKFDGYVTLADTVSSWCRNQRKEPSHDRQA